MKKFLLAGLLVIAFNSYGVTDNNQNGRPGNPGHIYSVPDSSSTGALLALAIAVMALLAMPKKA